MAEQVDREQRRKYGKRIACPFCGWTHTEIKKQQSVEERYWVRCQSIQCEARGPIADTRQEAVNAWNEGVARNENASEPGISITVSGTIVWKTQPAESGYRSA